MRILIPVEAPELTEQLDRLETAMAAVQAQLEELARMAQITQEQLDALSTAIDGAVAGIRQDIADLKAQIPNLDTSRIEASVAALEALDVENPPAPPATP